MDQGLLTDKQTLPVREMRFGDSHGDMEIAMFRLGELKCTGLGNMVLFFVCLFVYNYYY